MGQRKQFCTAWSSRVVLHCKLYAWVKFGDQKSFRFRWTTLREGWVSFFRLISVFPTFMREHCKHLKRCWLTKLASYEASSINENQREKCQASLSLQLLNSLAIYPHPHHLLARPRDFIRAPALCSPPNRFISMKSSASCTLQEDTWWRIDPDTELFLTQAHSQSYLLTANIYT